MAEAKPATSSGMTQASVRSRNLQLVFSEVLANSASLSRADIAARLGMTRSTVSRLVDDLIMGQLVDEGEAVGGARGRPAVPLRVKDRSVVSLGLEVNVERMVSVLVDLTGETFARRSAELDLTEMSVEEAMRHLSRLALETLAEVPDGARIAGAMLAFPGLIGRDGQLIVRSPNLGWEGYEPAAYWGVSFRGEDVSLAVRNDINCSALTVLGDTPGASFLYVTGEVGIGAAVSMDGTLLSGSHGWASEVGHICVDPRGAQCGCGAYGCLETVAGLHAFLTAAGQEDMDGVLKALGDGDGNAHTAVKQMAVALGIAIGAALNMVDVSTVRLGGHLGRLGDWLAEPLHKELSTRVLWAPHSGIELELIERAPLRAAMGAGLAALERVAQDPAAWVDPLLER